MRAIRLNTTNSNFQRNELSREWDGGGGGESKCKRTKTILIHIMCVYECVICVQLKWWIKIGPIERVIHIWNNGSKNSHRLLACCRSLCSDTNASQSRTLFAETLRRLLFKFLISCYILWILLMYSVCYSLSSPPPLILCECFLLWLLSLWSFVHGPPIACRLTICKQMTWPKKTRI